MDYIVCVDTFEHLAAKDRSQAIFEILRLLHEGGKAFIAFPCGKCVRDFNRSLWQATRRRDVRIDWLEEHMANEFPNAPTFWRRSRKIPRDCIQMYA